MPSPTSALLIVGMHRSGTSFLGECCGALGYALPRDAGGPADDNPRGHFEPRAIVDLNQRILLDQGAVWNRIGPILPPNAATWFPDIDEAVTESFGDAARIMVKDPRLSLILPLWRAWAEARSVRLAVLIALRDPAEVAWSLSRRDAMGSDAAILSWCEHTLASILGSEGLPRRLILFPEWSANPEPTLAAIAGLDGGVIPDDARQLISDRFLPEAVHGREAPRPEGPIADLGRDLFATLVEAWHRGEVPDAAVLAPFRERLTELSGIARQVEAAHSPHHRNATLQIDTYKGLWNQAKRDCAETSDHLALVAKQLVETEAQLDEALRESASALKATEVQRDEISSSLSEALRETEAQRDEIAELSAKRIADTEAQRDLAVKRVKQLVGAEAAAQEAASQRDSALALLSATEAQRDEMSALADSRWDTINTLQNEFAGATALVKATELQRDDMTKLADIRAVTIEDLERQLSGRAEAIDELQTELSRTTDHLQATEAQRDEMTELADQRWEAIARLQEQVAHATAHIAETERILNETAYWLEKERRTVLKPIYRRLYGLGGQTLRSFVSASTVERLKRRLPVPGGIPRGLAFTPLNPTAPVSQGYAEVPARSGDKPDVFVLSIINWDFRVQRPQHLATEMAAAGHRVFYIEMERETAAGSMREVAPGVHVVRLPARGMRSLASYTGVPSAAQARAWVEHFYALADAVGVSPVSHVVIEHPFWWNLAKHFSPEFQITFDCMDDIGGFSNTEVHVLEAEMDMIARADKMIVSSQYLYDKFSVMRPVTMVRNGTDVSHFTREPEAEPAPAWLAPTLKKGAIRVGYVGAIAEWFHTDLLEQVARDNPDFEIHLCGAVTAEPPLRLGKLPNVTLHGEIPYKDVPAFHKQMDVLIIPFQLLPIIQACDPVKFYEYSAVKRPTVSTSLPELARAGDLVFRADDAATFAAQIRHAAPLADDAAFGGELRQYALDNAWRFRAADMLAEMEREPKLSVVVLHYGADTEMTLATLHAMLGNGEVYPNLEVVLVDNGSTPEVLDVLRARAATDPRIVMVENGENLGFAKGNNRGIAAATGEYVLLLNNDTFLAPGALLAMVRHLQRNKEIGIVGPMTNNIGNEARIEIAYADMDEMAHAARDLATGHRGQWTPMAVCAYFCAMFRRADLDRLGDLPEVYGRGMFEDDDHCATFRADGLQMALAEDAFCHHHLSATFDALPSGEKQALFEKNKAVFESRWGKWVPHRYRDARPDATL